MTYLQSYQVTDPNLEPRFSRTPFNAFTCLPVKPEIRKLKYIQLYEKGSLKEMSRFPDSKRQHGGLEEENRTRKTLETPSTHQEKCYGEVCEV